jgi:hypothetical protein
MALRKPPTLGAINSKTSTTLKRLRRKRLLLAGTDMEEEIEKSCPSSANFATPQTRSPSTSQVKIFGSPPEPLFNQPANSIPDLLQQSLSSLAQLNDVAMASYQVDRSEGAFKTGKAIAYFIHLTERFNLPSDIKYRAIELFHRFMTRHISELYEHVQSTVDTANPLNWEVVETRLQHQVTLRALGCLQLATKLSLHYKIISINRIRSYLAGCGFRYTSTSLVQSEIRILKTLDYKVHHPSPLDYIEVLLEALGSNDQSLTIKQLYSVSCQILDIYYLNYNDVMSKLKRNSSKINPELEVDFLLLGGGIIGAAAFILHQPTSDHIVQSLSNISCIVIDDLFNLSAILIEIIMNDDSS